MLSDVTGLPQSYRERRGPMETSRLAACNAGRRRLSPRRFMKGRYRPKDAAAPMRVAATYPACPPCPPCPRDLCPVWIWRSDLKRNTCPVDTLDGCWTLTVERLLRLHRRRR